MILRVLLVAASLAALSGARSGSQEQARGAAPQTSEGPRWNVLFAIADDWGWPHAGVLGDSAARTPTFDGLAAGGVLFDRAFVSSPSCTPSRNAILTGQHFFRLASRIMRSILVDYARMANRQKRKDGRERLNLEWACDAPAEQPGPETVDLLDLELGLERLESIDPGLCRIVEMRFFGGLSHPEIAEATGKSLQSVERNWRLARAWLHSHLTA